MTVTNVALHSDAERIYNAFAPLYIERELIEVLRTSLNLYVEKTLVKQPPDLYIIELNRACEASSVWQFLRKRQSSPILIILDSEPSPPFYSYLFAYNPRNVTGYLLRSSISALLPEAVKTICRNSYYYDPKIIPIKNPKRS